MARKSPTLLIRAALTAMGLTVAAGAWVLTREPPCQVCRLPDGSLLELRDVSYGTHHPLIEQQLWQKLLAPLLSPGLQGRLVTVVGTPVNRLVRGASSAVPGDRSLPHPPGNGWRSSAHYARFPLRQPVGVLGNML